MIEQPPAQAHSAPSANAAASARFEALRQILLDGGDPLEALLSAADQRLLRAAAQARRFERAMFDGPVTAAAGAASADGPSPLRSAFERLVDLGVIVPLSGRNGWFAIEASRRARLMAAGEGDASDWTALHRDLAVWFEGQGVDGELEALYHRLTLGEPAALEHWQSLYGDARDRFDIARCESLLDLIEQRRAYLPPAFASTPSRERALLAARAGFAEDYFRTSRYIEREKLPFAFGEDEVELSLLEGVQRLLQDPARFILQLHAPGGSGKTMFLRWLAARWCLPQDVPIARLDFDFLQDSERSLASAFLLGKFVERLDPQLPGRPFYELLGSLAEERRRLAGSTPDQANDPDSTPKRLADLETEVCERMARVLVESRAGLPVLLVLDTLEEASLKHQVDLLALVQAVARLRERLHALAGDAERAPRLALIVSGRYTLAEQYGPVHEAFLGQLARCEVTPFSDDESRIYLDRRLAGIDRMPQPEVLQAVIERAAGSPFKLSLHADLLLATPGMSVADLGQGVDVDTLYLIERVLKRIADPALRWLLRYGVLARRLTREFVEQVLAASLRRALRGDLSADDPAQDGVAHRDWPRLWQRGGALDAAALASLWRNLREYASATSWISVEPSADDAVVIQPVVKHPMRRALMNQDRPVVERIHRTAIDRARRTLTESDDSRQQGEALADESFHDFLLRGPAAASTWWARLQRHEAQPALAIPLAQVVLSDDLRESELRSGTGTLRLVSVDTEARAHFTLARHYLALSQETEVASARERELSRARAGLARYDALVSTLGTNAGRLVPLVDEGELRCDLARDAAELQAGRAQLEASLGTHLSSERRGHVLLRLSRLSGPPGDPSARRYSRLWGQRALRQGEAEGYGEWVRDEAALLVAEGAPRAALRLWQQGMQRLADTSGRWPSAEDRVQARRELAEDEPRLLLGAALPAAALRRFLALHPQGRQPGLRFTVVRGQAVRDAHLDALMVEIQLLAGEPAAARDRAKAMLDALKSLRSEGLVQRWLQGLRVKALAAQSRACRTLMDFGPALDALSQEMSIHAETGDHGAELRTRLQMARINLFDIGNLRQAASQMQDHDDAMAGEPVELQVEHLLLRAALREATGSIGLQAPLIARARDLSSRSPSVAWGTRLRVFLATMGCCTPDWDRSQTVRAWVEQLARMDHAGVRLASSGGLRHVKPIEGMPPELVARVDRLLRVDALGLPGHLRLQPLDRIRMTLTRAEWLRVTGRREQAGEALQGLSRSIAAAEPAAWLRQVALACDRLGIAPTEVLPPDWLAAVLRRMRRERRFCAVLQTEAAARALAGGERSAAVRLLRSALREFDREATVPARWQVDALQLQARMAEAFPQAFPGIDLAASWARIRGLAEGLGVAVAAPLPPPPPPLQAKAPPLPSPAATPSPAESPVALRGLSIDSPEQVGHTAQNYRVPALEVVEQMKVARPLLPMLVQFAAGRFSDDASFDLSSGLGRGGVAYARQLCECGLPRTLAAAIDDAAREDGIELIIQHRVSGSGAMPWELLVPGWGPWPLGLHPGLREIWRTHPGDAAHARVVWLQHALRVLGERNMPTDGLLGPATLKALAGWGAHGQPMHPTALREVHREAAKVLGRGSRPPSVLLLKPSQSAEDASLRGASGPGLMQMYAATGVEVQMLEEPDVSLLDEVLNTMHPSVLHIAAPIAQSRGSRELSLQFAGRHDASHTTPLSPELVARMLLGLRPQERPGLVLLDIPRPASRDETVRQLLCRNAFAARLFEQARDLPVVATGLVQDERWYLYADKLIRAVTGSYAPAELVGDLRGGLRTGSAPGDMIDAIPSAGISLFAVEPWASPLLRREVR